MKKKRIAQTLAALVLGAAFQATPARAQHSVRLAWTASSDAAANPSLAYNVYRSANCAGAFARLNSAPVAATSYLDASALAGAWCYQVTAVLNGTESVPSSEAVAVIPLPPSAREGCARRGSLLGWIRCVAALPNARSQQDAKAKRPANATRHREAEPAP